MIKKIVNVMFFLALTLVYMAAHANNETVEWCEKQWMLESSEAVSGDKPSSYNALLKKWKSYEVECSGTVTYEARLASIFLFRNELSEARKVLRSVSEVNSNYAYLVDYLALLLDETELNEANGGMTYDEASLMEKSYKNYLVQHPDSFEGLSSLGSYQVLLGKYEEAVVTLEKGLGSAGNTWGIHRNLTIAYTELGQYESALKSANIAYELNENVLSDSSYVLSLVKTNAALGDYESAKSGLMVIVSKRPEVKGTPEFKEAEKFVIDSINKKLESIK